MNIELWEIAALVVALPLGLLLLTAAIGEIKIACRGW